MCVWVGVGSCCKKLLEKFSQIKGSPLTILGFSGGSEVKASACNVGDLGSIPGSGRSPGEGTGNPLQYSCLENPMDGEAWWATVHWGAKSQTSLSLSLLTTDGISVPAVSPSFLQTLGLNIYQRLFDFEINTCVGKILSLARLLLFISLLGAPTPSPREMDRSLSCLVFFFLKNN